MGKLSWKPIRRGAIFCSPACGSGCTHAAYLRARQLARELHYRMRSSGWVVEVSENMGWHYSLRHPKLDVGLHESIGATGSRRYSLSGPTSLVHDVLDTTDPNELVNRLMKVLRDKSMRVHDALLTLSLPPPEPKRKPLRRAA